MKKYIKGTKEECRGVFWIIDGELYAYQFYADNPIYMDSVDMQTYNHKRLWELLKPKNHDFDYYPRGRVDFKSDGTPIIYMNPNIDESFISEIKSEFGLRKEPIVHYDYSDHYRCHLDGGYKGR